MIEAVLAITLGAVLALVIMVAMLRADVQDLERQLQRLRLVNPTVETRPTEEHPNE